MFEVSVGRASGRGDAPAAASSRPASMTVRGAAEADQRAGVCGPASFAAGSAHSGVDRGVAAVRAAVEVLEKDTREAGGFSGRERRTVIAGVDGLIARLTAVRAGLLVAERDSGAWRAGGSASFAQSRGSASGAGQGAAVREERQADALVGMSQVGEAARSGVIGLAHVDVIARVAADRSESVRQAAASPAGQAELVELAKAQDAPSFARAATRWAASRDPDAHDASHQAQRRARFLVVSATDAGTRVNGCLDSESGYRLRLALEAVSGRPAADDDRSREQRAADALVTLAEAALADPATAPGAAVRPHVSYLMREQTFMALRRRRVRSLGSELGTSGVEPGPAVVEPGPSDVEPGPGPESDRGAAASATPEGVRASEPGPDGSIVLAPVGAGPGVSAPGAPPGEVSLMVHEDGTPVPRSEAERALCDCDLTRIVVDADDVPLNLGRTQRVYTGVHRRAIIARDRSCRWPGCGLAARWCEVHHIRWWGRHGGETSISNGVLLCSFHHHRAHENDLDIARLEPPPGDSRRGRERRRRRAHRPGEPAAGVSDHVPLLGDDHHDASGGARYRFIDSTGRVHAGPPWADPHPVPDPQPVPDTVPETVPETGTVPMPEMVPVPETERGQRSATSVEPPDDRLWSERSEGG